MLVIKRLLGVYAIATALSIIGSIPLSDRVNEPGYRLQVPDGIYIKTVITPPMFLLVFFCNGIWFAGSSVFLF